MMKKIGVQNILAEYLEKYETEFFEVVKKYSLLASLIPRNKPGVTLILPKVTEKHENKANFGHINSLLTQIYENREKVAALIIPYNLKNVKDLFSNIESARNKHLFISKVKNITNGIALLENGCKIYHHLCDTRIMKNNNINIFILNLDNYEAAPPPLDPLETPIITPPVPVKSPQAAKTKYYHEPHQLFSSKKSQQIRSNIAVCVENTFSNNAISAENTLFAGAYNKKYNFNSPVKLNAFMENIYSLVWYILNKKNHKNDYTEFDIDNLFVCRILPYISHSEIDFYFLIEPHRIQPDENNYVIPTIIIEDWWKNKTQVDIREVYDRINYELKNQHIENTFYGNKDNVFQNIEILRSQIEDCNPNNSADIIIKQYLSVSRANLINNTGLWPHWLASVYRQNPYRKILEDEIRYISFKQFEKINSNFELSSYEGWISAIARYMYQEPSEKKLRLLNKEKILGSVDPGALIKEICTFVQSSYYFFVPMSLSEISSYNDKFKAIDSRPNIDMSDEIWNIHEVAHNKIMNELEPDINNFKYLLRVIYEKEKDKMDPLAANAIRLYFGLNN